MEMAYQAREANDENEVIKITGVISIHLSSVFELKSEVGGCISRVFRYNSSYLFAFAKVIALRAGYNPIKRSLLSMFYLLTKLFALGTNIGLV
jgi:hypothetical protein